MRPIRALLLDAGNVLVADNNRLAVLQNIATLVQAPVIPSRTQLLNYEVLGRITFDLKTPKGYYGQVDIGEIDSGCFYTRFLKLIEVEEYDLPPQRFWPLYCSGLQPIPGVPAILIELAEAGMPLVMVSNGDSRSRYVADLFSLRYGIRWAGVVISCGLGVRKPHPRFFQVAYEDARQRLEDLSPDNVMLIDDVQEYCDAFIRCWPNASAYCFNGTQQSSEDLRSHLHRLGLPIKALGEFLHAPL